ncbi:MAG TPA: alpha/beta hydrolase [Mucilaginibacter sp.]|jgi:endo-1,4-beta-xylanase
MNPTRLLQILFAFVLLTAMISVTEPKEILLWPNGAPGSEGKTEPEKVRITDQGDIVISSVNKPSITPYLPSKEKSRGAAVIVAPGGGHSELWISHEGYTPARSLMKHGIAAFVLKYRLAHEKNSTYTVDKDELADIQRAIKLVRSRAKEWNIDTSKVGVIGFSAGGELAGLSSMRFSQSDPNATDPIDRENDRPDFQGLIYPGNLNRLEITKASPPAFIAGGYQDRPDISEGMARLYLKFKEAGVPAELHIYSNAGHGFGIRKTNTGALAQWPEEFRIWLSDMKFLKGDRSN